MFAFNHLATGKFQEWLYGDWDEEKFNKFAMLYSVPGMRQYIDYLLDRRRSEEYLDRYGMDYTDIHDPRKLWVTGSASNMMGFAYHTVSRNVDKLYK